MRAAYEALLDESQRARAYLGARPSDAELERWQAEFGDAVRDAVASQEREHRRVEGVTTFIASISRLSLAEARARST